MLSLVARNGCGEIVDMFDEVFGGLDRYSEFRCPSVDVKSNEKEFIVTAEMPGMKTDEIDIAFEDKLLTIKGERKTSEEEKKESYYVREHRNGSFMRQVRIADGIDESKIKADYKDGILSVSLPKMKKEKKIKIAVK